jgi:hypothetical protein
MVPRRSLPLQSGCPAALCQSAQLRVKSQPPLLPLCQCCLTAECARACRAAALSSLALARSAWLRIALTRCAAIKGDPSRSFSLCPSPSVCSGKLPPLSLFSTHRDHHGQPNSLPLLPFAQVPKHHRALELHADRPHQHLPRRMGCHAVVAPVSSHATAATPPRSALKSSTMSRRCTVSQGTPW